METCHVFARECKGRAGSVGVGVGTGFSMYCTQCVVMHMTLTSNKFIKDTS